jgi:hypothetical protein
MCLGLKYWLIWKASLYSTKELAKDTHRDSEQCSLTRPSLPNLLMTSSRRKAENMWGAECGESDSETESFPVFASFSSHSQGCLNCQSYEYAGNLLRHDTLRRLSWLSLNEPFCGLQLCTTYIHIYLSIIISRDYRQQERRCVCTGFWWENLKERDHFGEPGVDGRIILRWLFHGL